MKASLLKLHRRKEQAEGKRKSNYRIIVFSICFVISFAFWLMNMLSKKYTESILFYIQYEHLPIPATTADATDTIRIKVNTNGYRVLGYKLGVLDRFIKFDGGQFRHRDKLYYYALTNHIHFEKVEEQLGEEVKVMDISPDTLFIRQVPPKSLITTNTAD